VHDLQDGLTINWANDYPGGVVINGATTINGPVLLPKDGLSAPRIELLLESMERLELPGGPGPLVPVFRMEDLSQVIYDLRQQIVDLQRQIVELKT
jgi:hypothetical protein